MTEPIARDPNDFVILEYTCCWEGGSSPELEPELTRDRVRSGVTGDV